LEGLGIKVAIVFPGIIDTPMAITNRPQIRPEYDLFA